MNEKKVRVKAKPTNRIEKVYKVHIWDDCVMVQDEKEKVAVSCSWEGAAQGVGISDKLLEIASGFHSCLENLFGVDQNDEINVGDIVVVDDSKGTHKHLWNCLDGLNYPVETEDDINLAYVALQAFKFGDKRTPKGLCQVLIASKNMYGEDIAIILDENNQSHAYDIEALRKVDVYR